MKPIEGGGKALRLLVTRGILNEPGIKRCVADEPTTVTESEDDLTSLVTFRLGAALHE
jgi:hypothetical protein